MSLQWSTDSDCTREETVIILVMLVWFLAIFGITALAYFLMRGIR